MSTSMALVPTSSAQLRKTKTTSSALALVNPAQKALPPSNSSPASKVDDAKSTSNKPKKDEVQFCELVPMIHEWVQKSFTPAQEERLERKGRLCARFKVKLGPKMADHLQAYVKASFALRLLLVRVRRLEPAGAAAAVAAAAAAAAAASIAPQRKKKQQGQANAASQAAAAAAKLAAESEEVVEIVMTPEARALYAEKNPEGVKKFQQQLVSATDAVGTGGLVDEDEEDEGEEDEEQLALEDKRLALEDAKKKTQEPSTRPSTGGKKEDGRRGQAHADTEQEEANRNDITDTCNQEAANLKQKQKQKRKEESREEQAGQPSKKKQKGQPSPEEKKPLTPPTLAAAAAATAGGTRQSKLEEIGLVGTGSMWERCQANEILPGQVGLVEAREALSDGLSLKAVGGMEAVRAEKESVAWLKGLLEVPEVSALDLKETRIGLVVNDWRKQSDPYISRLASALLSQWKKSWKAASSSSEQQAKEAKAIAKRKSASVAAAAAAAS